MGHKDQDRTRQTDTQPGKPVADRPGPEQTWDKERPRDWEGRSTDLEQGDATRPAQPDGTTPLERDMAPVNQKR